MEFPVILDASTFTWCNHNAPRKSGSRWYNFIKFLAISFNSIIHLCPFQYYIHMFHDVLEWVNTVRPRQNGRHFPGDIFKCIFLNENIWTITISLTFPPKGSIDSILALVQIMVWRLPGDKPLVEPMMVINYRRIYASLRLNELSCEKCIDWHVVK